MYNSTKQLTFAVSTARCLTHLLFRTNFHIPSREFLMKKCLLSQKSISGTDFHFPRVIGKTDVNCIQEKSAVRKCQAFLCLIQHYHPMLWSVRPRLHEIGSKWIRTQTVTDRPCVYTGLDGSEPIWICYPYPNGITFEGDPVWIRSQEGLV